MNSSFKKWQFFIDRGGTFTDVVALRPDGALITHKLLSENPEQYEDASLQGIRDVLKFSAQEPLPVDKIESVKMGTTVATNALLERKGERAALVITKGFGDALRIGYQNRPKIFARQITRPQMLYEAVIEAHERLSAKGEVLVPLNKEKLTRELTAVFDAGIRSVAICLMHGYRYFDHEREVARICREIGFTHVAASHEVSPLIKLVRRGDTVMLDAYLTPILKRYCDRVAGELGKTRLFFMQSNGGLAKAEHFRGKDSILSGPAGGVVGAVKTAEEAGFKKIIAFDMGGTSTDVTHYDGEYERRYESAVAGVRLIAPMMNIHTVAAGGGSVCVFDGMRFRVGPRSVGANPGPACYRRGGELAVTDCNLLLGKLHPDFFPKVFGKNANEPLDKEIVIKKFTALAKQIQKDTGERKSPEEIAEGFIAIAVENMANAIKKISIQRGRDVTDYVLCCFGGAAGQHACLVADALGISRVMIHPHAGVLSAYGIGLADVRVLRQKPLECALSEKTLPRCQKAIKELTDVTRRKVADQGVAEENITTIPRIHLRYEGTDTTLIVDFGTPAQMKTAFETQHKQRFGFLAPDTPLTIEAVSVEAVGKTNRQGEPRLKPTTHKTRALKAVATVRMYSHGSYHQTPIYKRQDMAPGQPVTGPALIIETNTTTVVEPGWGAEVTEKNHLILKRVRPRAAKKAVGTRVDPVRLEIFNNLFMAIAEQMGVTLKKTTQSVNIRERLDFSCAIFDPTGGLVANAPHIPVHLGSMSESVRAILRARRNTMRPGDVFALNTPYNGGTHLPDVTIITPVFDESGKHIIFFVGSRGHHADIGGITPGSMPPFSRIIEEEGVVIDNFQIVRGGCFLEKETRDLLTKGKYPARDPKRNISDFKAQIAANEKGVQEIKKMIRQYSLATVQAYMRHVQDYAEESVRRVIDRLSDGSFAVDLDNGARIAVAIRVDTKRREATIDFSGTSPQMDNNFNAPPAVCRAAVLYVLRTLIDTEIPLNEGCLKPIKIVIPQRSLLNPVPPAAVVAGNVETSQHITNCLYGALGIMAASQGTMNNLAFGNKRYQYYETVCGGSGAGPDFHGTDAVHTHMTNSRLTDPEVLEMRFPVLVAAFQIRKGSGGKGRFDGGCGAIRRIRFLEPMTASILSSHRVVAPFGLMGGDSGQVGKNYVVRKNGHTENLKGCDQIEVESGDTLVIETPGGGGFGKTSR